MGSYLAGVPWPDGLSELLEARDVERLLNAATEVAADSPNHPVIGAKVSWFKTSFISESRHRSYRWQLRSALSLLDLGWLQVHRHGQALSLQAWTGPRPEFGTVDGSEQLAITRDGGQLAESGARPEASPRRREDGGSGGRGSGP